MIEETRYNPTFDVMNICACVAVVALHVNGGIWGFSRSMNWAMMLITECVCYWAVPIFFMISGATLIDYRERYSTKKFFRKRFEKTVIPFLFWSIVSVFWAVYIEHSLDEGVLIDIRLFVDSIMNTRAMSIYWFFPAIFAVYLTIPVLSEIAQEKREKTFRYGIVMAFIFTSCLPLLSSILHISYNVALDYPLNGGGYVMYVLLGYYITHYNISPDVRMKIIYPLGIIGLLMRYIGTLVLSFRTGEIDWTYGGYSRFPCVVFSVAVFVWFWYHDWTFIVQKTRCKNIVRIMSKASFGVYLTHFYILRFFVEQFEIPMRAWQWRILGVPCVYLLALGVTILLQKIPVINKIIP